MARSLSENRNRQVFAPAKPALSTFHGGRNEGNLTQNQLFRSRFSILEQTPSLVVRDIDDGIVKVLKVRAGIHGVSAILCAQLDSNFDFVMVIANQNYIFHQKKRVL